MLYVDSVNGDDCNNGTSPETAFATLEKINGLTLKPGETVLLKCGSVFFGTLKPKNGGTYEAPVRITSYGEGPFPVIDGNGNENTVEIRNISHIEISRLCVTNRSDNNDVCRRGVFVCGGGYGTVNRRFQKISVTKPVTAAGTVNKLVVEFDNFFYG